MFFSLMIGSEWTGIVLFYQQQKNSCYRTFGISDATGKECARTKNKLSVFQTTSLQYLVLVLTLICCMKAGWGLDLSFKYEA